MLETLSFWGYAGAAFAFAVLATWQARERGGRVTLAAAFGATALWALTAAAFGPVALPTRLFESASTIAWLGFMLALLVGNRVDQRRSSVVTLYALVAGVAFAQAAVDLSAHLLDGPEMGPLAVHAMLLLRMTSAIAALLLLHNLYTAADPLARGALRVPLSALAAIWVYDLNLYTIAYLGQAWPIALLALRGPLLLLLSPLLGLAGRRSFGGRLQLSRAATFQSLSMMAIGGYLVAMVLVARAFEGLGGDRSGLAQIGVVIGMGVIALAVLPERGRAWMRVKVAKHLFRHRYDYRAEWLRFTATLGRSGDDAAPLDVRAVQAVADITQSPGGLLLLPDETGNLTSASRWRWNTLDPPAHAANAALARFLEDTGRILELDALRGGGDAPEAVLMPEWLLAATDAWAAVPLVHVGRLVGVVLLARPPLDRALDWEDFDLLRVAGRQVASHLAEASSQEALGESRRFDEFNRRFAFIMHDIKNLVSQLSLVTRNAERHADNPAFRADMIATLQDSTAKLNALLARLSQHHRTRAEEPRPTDLRAVALAIAATKAKLHPVQVAGDPLIASADPVRLEQALAHLVQNAIDASPPAEPVWLRLERRGLEAAIEVLDRGQGMSGEFVRTRLFKPFASTKEGGFGIGAFEARTLVAAMGGRLEVESREGEGTRFSLILPLSDAPALRQHA